MVINFWHYFHDQTQTKNKDNNILYKFNWRKQAIYIQIQTQKNNNENVWSFVYFLKLHQFLGFLG